MGADAAITLLFGLLDRAATWATEIQSAKAEGREVNLDIFVAGDDAARKELQDAIRVAKGG